MRHLCTRQEVALHQQRMVAMKVETFQVDLVAASSKEGELTPAMGSSIFCDRRMHLIVQMWKADTGLFRSFSCVEM